MNVLCLTQPLRMRKRLAAVLVYMGLGLRFRLELGHFSGVY